MVVTKNVVVVGDGAAGIMTANKIRYLNSEKDARVTLIGNNVKNFCRSDGPQIALRMKKFNESVKPVNFLLNNGVEFVRDEVMQVRPKNRLLYLKSGKKFDYDYLVLAPGLADAPEKLPGYEGEAKHILDMQHALELGKTLENLTEGTVIVATNGASAPNLMGFFELALVYMEQLANIKSKIKMKFVSPDKGAFPLQELSAFFAEKFESVGIELVTEFKVTSINQKNKEIVSAENKTLNYDVLVLPPPLKTREFLGNDDLLGNDGSKNINKTRLTVRDYDDVYISGDAFDFLAEELSGSFVTQSRFISHSISLDINSSFDSAQYAGGVTLSAMTGLSKGITVSYSYDKRPKAPAESMADFRFKKHYSDFYFSSLIRGII
jgi:sulfide:quinone oxidoreductase